MILVLYVDDRIITGNSTILIDKVKFNLQQHFDMEDLGLIIFLSLLFLFDMEFKAYLILLCIV